MKKLLLTLILVFAVLFSIGALNVLAGTYGDLDYMIENNEVVITYCDRDVSSVEIPTEIEGYPVTTIRSVSHCKKLTSIKIPHSVKYIEKYAFAGCSSLKNIDISDGVIAIGENAFSECSSLKTLNIPDSVTSIGGYAFYNCDSLESVDIGKGITCIDTFTFYGCSSLTNVNIPNNVTSIGIYAFKKCHNLSNVDIAYGVISIESEAFSECDKLASINIPSSVTTIDSWAFDNCNNLKTVYYSGTEEQWNRINIHPYGNDSFFDANIIFNYKPITVTYNGEKIGFDQQPVIENGRTLVPLRAIFEKLGAEVEWDGATQTVIAKKADTTIELTINDTNAKKNGSIISLDVPAKIINGRTLVPVRFVSDCFGVGVEWNAENQQVVLTAE